MATDFITETEIETILRGVIDLFLIPRFEELGMNASGEWRDNLEVRGSSIWGRYYTEYLQYGRGPNRNQDTDYLRRWAYGMANYNPEFKRWLEIKGLTEFGVGIAYNIGKEGTQYYKDGGTTLLEVLNEPKTLDYIKEQSMSIVKDKVMVDINRQLSNFKTI